jgi:RNA polymerase sigma factor (TIGR02999 family)
MPNIVPAGPQPAPEHAGAGLDAGPALDALDALVPVVYEELRAIARRRLAAAAGRAAGGTLATTALVHEAYLKLAAGAGAGAPGAWRDRAHFLATAAVAMRQILIDRARALAAPKHGGARVRVSLDHDAIAAGDDAAALLELDDALARLAAASPRLARVVVCRFYGGMEEEEIAAALGLTVRTVQRDWVKARVFLRRALTG